MERIIRNPWGDFDDFYEKTLEEVEFFSNDDNTFQFRGTLKFKDPDMTVRECAEKLKDLVNPGDGLYFPKDNIFLARSFTGDFWYPLSKSQLTSAMFTPKQEQQKKEKEEQEKIACMLDLLALS